MRVAVLVVRKAQIDALAGVHRSRFAAAMANRLAVRFPEAERAAGGPSGFRRAVDEGVERAFGYGLTRAMDLAQFLGVMVLFGPRFDLDPALPWAGLALRREALDGAAKAGLLRGAAQAALARRAMARAETRER